MNDLNRIMQIFAMTNKGFVPATTGFTDHREGGEQDGVLTPFGCSSRSRCVHPQAACQQRSIVADLGECPPCPESWP